MSEAPQIDPYLPITYGHDLAAQPIGFATNENGHFVLNLRESTKLTEKDINTANKVFAPTYMITEVDKKGYVRKLELVSFGVISQKK